MDMDHKVLKINALMQVVVERTKTRPLDEDTCLLIEILHDLCCDLEPKKDGPGRKGRNWAAQTALTFCAAAVTILKKDVGVDAAIKEVAEASRFSPKEIKNFRDGISRRTVPSDCVHAYKETLTEYESRPKDRILDQLKVQGHIVGRISRAELERIL
jgi:hypothetical protein